MPSGQRKKRAQTKFDPTAIEDASLSLVRDANFYMDKLFSLDFIDGDGNELRVQLDGIQVGDIVADAAEAGLPIKWLAVKR